MSQARKSLSISGLCDNLIAFGGFCKHSLAICEKYLVAQNKWSSLPTLNTARYSPGSILVASKRAYCFGGY